MMTQLKNTDRGENFKNHIKGTNMKKYLLPNEGNFYKANLHVHTNISDGNMTPEEIKKVYSEKGYSIVAYTDHEVMVPHADLTDDNFLAITSTEIIINDRYDCDFCYAKTYHLNIYSPNENQSSFSAFDESKMWLEHSKKFITPEQRANGCDRVYDVERVNDLIKKANDDGCFVSYNHPVWSSQDYSDYIDLKGLWGVEVYNTGCEMAGYFDSAKPFDDLLRKGNRIFPLATDDAHKLQDCFGGFVMVRADELKYDKIFNALKRGDFYASTRPELYEISIEDGIVKVLSSPVSLVCISTDCRHQYFKRAEEASLTETYLDINNYLKLANDGINEHQYIRITVVDENGNCAYSRAYFMDELI